MATEVFSLKVEVGKVYEMQVEETFRITMATLSPDAKGKTSMTVKVNDEEFVLCNLISDKIEQQPLDLMFSVGEIVSFGAVGASTIYLSGNYILEDDQEDGMDPADMYGDEDEFSDEEIDSDDMARIEEIVSGEEDSEMEEEEEEVVQVQVKDNKKRALEQAPKVEAKKVKQEEAKSALPSPPPSAKKAAPVVEAKKAEVKPAAAKAEVKKAEVKKTEAKAEVKVEAKKAEVKKADAKVEVKKTEAKPVAAKAEKPVAEKAEVKKQTLAGGLIVEDHVTGSGPAAKKGKRCSLRYIGKLSNGKVFDQNTNGKPFTFVLGKGEVIKGWDLGVADMKVGGVRKLTIPAALAYGAKGAKPDIPGNATLTFEVKLLDVK